MKYKVLLFCVSLSVLCSAILCAQSVIYSPVVANSSTSLFEVVGKAGNFYWIQKKEENNSFSRRKARGRSNTDLSFEIFDARLHRVKEFSYAISDTALKQYLVAGDQFFDRLVFLGTSHKTRIVLDRYTPDGTIAGEQVPLIDFPESMKGNDFLLVRSQDKTKLLLLGFEPVADATPRVHAVLYNSNWKVLFQTVYKDPNLTQPCLQYDFSNLPMEHFDNGPLKLANNGSWLMVGPSRRNRNYLLFYFQGTNSSFVQNEIKLPQNTRVENAALSLDNDKEESLMGILLSTATPSVKKVRTGLYRMADCRFDFDTAYRISTVAAGKTKDENLFEQDFIPVPGKGFLFLKEYGKPFLFSPLQEGRALNDEEPENTQSAIRPVPLPFNKDDYTHYNSLGGGGREFERGDLRFYYFAATKQDSCWSGLLNKAQTTELNSSYLSYVCMSVEGRIVFLYNSLFRNTTPFSTTTMLDQKGALLNEGLVFWRSASVLQFQKTRQTALHELMIPYEKNGLGGFAVIRL